MICLQLISANWAGNEWSVKSDLRCFLFFFDTLNMGTYKSISRDCQSQQAGPDPCRENPPAGYIIYFFSAVWLRHNYLIWSREPTKRTRWNTLFSHSIFPSIVRSPSQHGVLYTSSPVIDEKAEKTILWTISTNKVKRVTLLKNVLLFCSCDCSSSQRNQSAKERDGQIDTLNKHPQKSDHDEAFDAHRCVILLVLLLVVQFCLGGARTRKRWGQNERERRVLAR